MALTITAKKVAVSMKLDNGISDDNKVISVSLGSLDPETYSDEMAIMLVHLIEPCLDNDLVRTERTKVDVLEVV